MRKKIYIAPGMEIEEFDVEDIITVSVTAEENDPTIITGDNEGEGF